VAVFLCEWLLPCGKGSPSVATVSWSEGAVMAAKIGSWCSGPRGPNNGDFAIVLFLRQIVVSLDVGLLDLAMDKFRSFLSMGAWHPSLVPLFSANAAS
jgi:hypothetical protein